MQQKYQKGQIVLIVLLIMVVGLTMGLAVISRSVTNIKMSTQTEQSQRAFSAAEAGIEEFLRAGTIGTYPIGGASFTVSKSGVGGGIDPYVIKDVARDDTQTIWLAAHNADGTINEISGWYNETTINLCWDGNAALEAILLYKGGGVYKVSRYAVDPNDGRRGSNQFDPPDDGGGCADLSKKKTISLPALTVRIALRLRPIYSGDSLGVEPVIPGVLPSQGDLIESLGQSAETSRKVQVFQSYPVLPPIFDYVLFSGQSLTK